MKRFRQQLKEQRDRILYFFPVQLLLLNFKKNQVLLLFWLLLISIVTSNFGRGVGLPFLFLDPEYNHDVTFTSMVIMGVSYGIFTVSFFTTSYILDSHRFPFLGTIKYPFVKYCLNNSIFPVIFFVLYIYKYIQFQTDYGLEAKGEIFLEALGFLLGSAVTVVIIFAYFRKTNRDVFKHLAGNIDTELRKRKINTVQVIKKLRNANKRRYTISSYIGLNGRIQYVDQDFKIDKVALLKVIDQHHLNAVTVEIFVFITIIVIGIFRDNPVFQIPAAASGLLLSSFIIMFTGAFSYWLRGWAITGVMVLFVIVNFLFKKDIIKSHYEAFGIDYETEAVEYSRESIEKLNSDEHFFQDRENTLAILENWRKKFPADEPPKMVFIGMSGGGQRAAVWTTNVLRYADSTLNGEMMNHTMLMTGASGGLIGGSYYRELYYRDKLGEIPSAHDPKYVDNISKDILNPMIFSLVVSDIFLRFQKVDYHGHRYFKGRGYAFEEQLNANTDWVMDKSLAAYREPELNAEIPMMIMSPSIINDGRKLHISPHHVSYMGRPEPLADSLLHPRAKGIDFLHCFEYQDAENLRFLSALRMSATFPYVTPNVHLPTDPPIEIMDAGMTDNFGITDAVRFMYTFRDWIEKNTSGVIFISVRDSAKDPEVEKNKSRTVLNRLFNPVRSIYTNWDFVQDFKNDAAMEFASSWFDKPINYIDFEYIPRPKGWNESMSADEAEEELDRERASLSWHLTALEKQSIKRTIYEENNQKALQQLIELLGKKE